MNSEKKNRKRNNKSTELRGLLLLLVPMLLIVVKPLYSFAGVEGQAAEFSGPIGFTQPETGKWQLENGQWSYLTDQGILRNRWACILSEGNKVREWYCFDSGGHLLTGWQKGAGGNWYYLRKTADDRFGAMEKGLLYEPEDGNCYYFDPDTGAMRTGWVRYEGKWRYFTENGDPDTWKWDSTAGRWVYRQGSGRSTGAMYVNEKTPDGYYVDAQGVCFEK